MGVVSRMLRIMMKIRVDLLMRNLVFQVMI